MSSRVGNTVPRGMPCLEWNTVSSWIPLTSYRMPAVLPGISRCMGYSASRSVRCHCTCDTAPGGIPVRVTAWGGTMVRGIPCRAGYRVVRGTEPGAPCGAGFQDKPVEAEPLASDDGKLMMLDEGISLAPHGVGVPRS